jgi:hypothetical protein
MGPHSGTGLKITKLTVGGTYYGNKSYLLLLVNIFMRHEYGFDSPSAEDE